MTKLFECMSKYEVSTLIANELGILAHNRYGCYIKIYREINSVSFLAAAEEFRDFHGKYPDEILDCETGKVHKAIGKPLISEFVKQVTG